MPSREGGGGEGRVNSVSHTKEVRGLQVLQRRGPLLSPDTRPAGARGRLQKPGTRAGPKKKKKKKNPEIM